MDFLSIGPLEVIVVVVVALIVLGPQKMLEVAQKAGRSMSKMQGTVKNLLSTDDIDSEPEPDSTMPGQRESIQFTVDQAGNYSMVCYIAGHALTGMWVYFNVSGDGSVGVQQ